MLILLLVVFNAFGQDQVDSIPTQVFTKPQNTEDYTVYTKQLSKINFYNTKNIYSLQLKSQKVKQEETKMKNNQYIEIIKQGCFPQQSQIRTKPEMLLNINQNTLSHYDQQNQILFLLHQNNLTLFQLRFVNETIDYKDYKNHKRNEFHKMQKLLQTNLNLAGQPIYLLGDDTTKSKQIHVLTETTLSTIVYDQINFNDTLQLTTTKYSPFCQSILDISLIKSQNIFIVLCGLQGIYLIDSKMNVIQNVSSKYDELTYNFTKIKSFDYQRYFYLLDELSGLYQFYYEKGSKTLKKGSSSYQQQDIVDFDVSYNSMVVATKFEIIEIMFTLDKSQQYYLKNIQKIESKVTNIFLNEYIQIVSFDETNQVQWPPNAFSNSSYYTKPESSFYHPYLNKVFFSIKYGQPNILITLSDNLLTLTKIDLIDAHIQCYFKDSQTLAYDYVLVSEFCNDLVKNAKYYQVCQHNGTLLSNIHLLWNITDIVEVEKVYSKSGSLKKILVFALGIPLLLVCLALAIYIYYIFSKKEIKKITEYKESQMKQLQHNDLENEESIQIQKHYKEQKTPNSEIEMS